MSSKEARTYHLLFRLAIEAEDIPQLLSKDVDEFVDSQSIKIFERYGLPTDFLAIDPSQWGESVAYQECKEFFREFVVVNDAAERSVALTREYLGLVKSEDQYQNLLLVAQHTRRFKSSHNYTKAALSENCLIKKIFFCKKIASEIFVGRCFPKTSHLKKSGLNPLTCSCDSFVYEV